MIPARVGRQVRSPQTFELSATVRTRSGPVRQQQREGIRGLIGVGKQDVLTAMQCRSVGDDDGPLGADAKTTGHHEPWLTAGLRDSKSFDGRLQRALDLTPVRHALEAFLADQNGLATGTNGDGGCGFDHACYIGTIAEMSPS